MIKIYFILRSRKLFRLNYCRTNGYVFIVNGILFVYLLTQIFFFFHEVYHFLMIKFEIPLLDIQFCNLEDLDKRLLRAASLAEFREHLPGTGGGL